MEGRGREREGKEAGKWDGVGGGREGEKGEKKRREDKRRNWMLAISSIADRRRYDPHQVFPGVYLLPTCI